MAEVLGLVLAGGKSSRMGKDKRFLEFNGKELWKHQEDLFKSLGLKAYFSVDKAQPKIPKHLQIVDSFGDLGPLGGIASAMSAFPGVSFLVMPVDVVFNDEFDLNIIRKLMKALPKASVLYNSKRDEIEPLMGVYPGRLFKGLIQAIRIEKLSVRSFVEENGFEKEMVYQSWKNLNWPEDL